MYLPAFFEPNLERGKSKRGLTPRTQRRTFKERAKQARRAVRIRARSEADLASQMRGGVKK
jgi:hypothetical protein